MFIRSKANGNPEVAFLHAHQIISIEKKLHIFWELQLQNWILKKAWLVHLMNGIYTFCYHPFILAVMMWIYIQREEEFPLARNGFFLVGGIALIFFWLYPTAPPRFMEEYGFTDTISLFLVYHHLARFPFLQFLCCNAKSSLRMGALCRNYAFYVFQEAYSKNSGNSHSLSSVCCYNSDRQPFFP